MVPARELWTGDWIVRHVGIVTALKPDIGHDGAEWVEVQIANAIETRDTTFPIEMVEGRWMRMKGTTQVEIIRDYPLPNGMHMTQLGLDGKCHGRAHPVLEERLRAEGKLAGDYRR